MPLYSRVGARLSRNRLVVGTTLFFASHLVAFYLVGVALGSSLGFAVAFYLWIAIFNMMIVAQFWGFANDLYAEETGSRVFPLLGFGGSLGAVVGAATAGALIARLGVMPMMMVAAAILSASAALSQWIHARDAHQSGSATALEAIGGGGAGDAFRAILGDRFLLDIAGFSLVFTLVKTNGDYVLAQAVEAAANQAVRAGTLAPGQVPRAIGETFASYTFWVDSLSLVLQGLAVSRVVKVLRLRRRLLYVAVSRARRRRAHDDLARPRDGAHRQDRRERHRLFAEQHGAQHALAADHAAGEIPGQAGDRHVLHPPRRHQQCRARLRGHPHGLARLGDPAQQRGARRRVAAARARHPARARIAAGPPARIFKRT